jgi:hypothetical protein
VDGRRIGNAGGAFVTCVLALAFAFVLNAPGAHKRAYNEPDGWKRDVALAVTGPLDAISGALLLDRPRVGLQALSGRSGADDIDTDLGIVPEEPATPPQGTSDPTPPPAEPPRRKPAFTPARPLRLLIAGDSLVIIPGFAILRAAAGNRAIKPVGRVDGRVSTGLARPDVYNWFDALRERMRKEKPRAVVLAFGGNDTNAYMTGLPEGVSIDGFGSAAWTKEYRRRAGALFDIVARGGGHTIWIGLPVTRDPELARKFDTVNAAVAAEARERPRTVTYVDTYLAFAGADGGYAEYLQRPDGSEVKVRAADGIHFEPAGGDLIADRVLDALGAVYDIAQPTKSATS